MSFGLDPGKLGFKLGDVLIGLKAGTTDVPEAIQTTDGRLHTLQYLWNADTLAWEVATAGASGAAKMTLVGVDGTAAKIKVNLNTSSPELLVNLEGHVCLENSTTTPLGTNGVFLGSGWQDTLDYGVVSVNISADQDSATDGLVVQWSNDGVSVRDTDSFSILANRAKTFTFGPAERYIRLKYANGPVAQGDFHVDTLLRRVYVKPSSHRITDSIVAEDDAELVKAVITGRTPSGVFVNLTATPAGNLKVANVEDGLSISRGLVEGLSSRNTFGNAPDFDTSDGSVTIWDGADDGGPNAMQYTYSASADIDSISSSSASDTQLIEVQGLTFGGVEVTQTATLNGQTRVALGTPLWRVFWMKNSGGTGNAGRVFCFVNTALVAGVPTDSTKVRAVIQPGLNQTLMAVYTIPFGKAGYLRSMFASTAGAKKTADYQLDLRVRQYGGVFQIKHRTSISDTGTSAMGHSYTEPPSFPALSDLSFQVACLTASVTGCAISAGFNLVLVDL